MVQISLLPSQVPPILTLPRAVSAHRSTPDHEGCWHTTSMSTQGVAPDLNRVSARVIRSERA